MIRSLYARILQRFFGMKKEAVLDRFECANGVTLGSFTVGDLNLATIERPWLDNKPRVSCIPKGRYLCKPFNWAEDKRFKFKRVYEITGVPNRFAVLLHGGNFVTDSSGCPILGMKHGKINGVPAVLSSKIALDMLRSEIGENEFWLTIKGV